MKTKYIILAGFIPIVIVLFFAVWNLILKGLSEKSDITILISVSAIGFIIVATGLIVKFILKKS